MTRQSAAARYNRRGMDKKTKFNRGYQFIVIAPWGGVILHSLWMQATRIKQIPYRQFPAHLPAARIEEIRIMQHSMQGTLKDAVDGQSGRFVTARAAFRRAGRANTIYMEQAVKVR